MSHFFLRKLVTGRINTQEFLSSNITSTNGKLIKDMLRRLDQDHQEIPGPYLPFLTDLGKFTSVFGLIQPTGPRALELLQVFQQ